MKKRLSLVSSSDLTEFLAIVLLWEVCPQKCKWIKINSNNKKQTDGKNKNTILVLKAILALKAIL